MIETLLVANRGEIASRIIRTCRQLGIRTVAVCSEVDREAKHVREADLVETIGPADAVESYLVPGKVLAAAKRAGADAIHPGYGFLSENADFARMVTAAGITFVGPSPESIERMGLKSSARSVAQELGVPVLAGTDSGIRTIEELREVPSQRYPLALKASAGGGGRGIRVVERAEDLERSFREAQAEALAAFGDDEILIEQWLVRPRHIEVQLAGDKHGNLIHLGTRECSIQRRRQKVLEEAPAPIPDAIRVIAEEAAVKFGRAIGYDSLGTIEFLYDPTDGAVFFLEMNTRLQVEHPVTELVTGLDLVEIQILAAAGEVLPLRQEELVLRGSAIEARVNAEVPDQEYRPATGTIIRFDMPDIPGVRLDSGYSANDLIGPHYDSLVAKVIAAATTRDHARRLLARALEGTTLFGVETNIVDLVRIVDHEAMRVGDLSTRFLDEYPPQALPPTADVLIATAIEVAFQDLPSPGPEPLAAWRQLGPWRVLGPAGHGGQRRVVLENLGERYVVEFRDLEITPSGDRLTATACVGDFDPVIISARRDAAGVVVECNDSIRRWEIARAGTDLWIAGQGKTHRFELITRMAEASASAAVSDAGGARPLVTTIPGKITAVEVSSGQAVNSGDVLVSMEAMKMIHNLRASANAVVRHIRCRVGDTVPTGEVLVEFEDEG